MRKVPNRFAGAVQAAGERLGHAGGIQGDLPKYSLIAILTVAALLLTAYFHLVMRSGIVFTQLFYIPIMLAAYWFGYRGIVVPLILASALIATDLWQADMAMLGDDLLRVGIFIAVSLIAAHLKVQKSKATEGQRESEEQYKSLFETASVMMQSVGPDGKYLIVNREWKKRLGYNDSDLKQLTFMDVVRKDFREHCANAFKQVSAGKSLYGIDVVFVAKDGSEIDASGNIRPIMKDGKFIYTVGSFIDVTERKKAENITRDFAKKLEREVETRTEELNATNEELKATNEEMEATNEELKATSEDLRASEEKYRTIVENVNDAILTYDSTGRILDVNEVACKVFGYSKKEIIGSTLEKINSKENRPKVRKRLSELFKKGKLLWETTDIRKDGSPLLVYASAKVISRSGRGIAQSFLRDITGLKKAEEDIALNSQRMQALLNLDQMAGATLKEITDFALEEAVRLTQSTIGYLAFLNEDESILTMHSWSKTAMAECAIRTKSIVYPVASTGLWGEAVRQRKPVITNDYAAASPLKKGIPKGHVFLKRHMNIPVFDGSRIVAVAGVGNKTGEYNQSDVQQLTLLIEGMWRLLERKKAEEQLRSMGQQWQITFDATSDIFMVMDKDFVVIKANKATSDLLKLPVEKIIGKHCYELIHGTKQPIIGCPLARLKASLKHEESELFLANLGAWVQVTVDPVFDDKGGLKEIVHVVRNITKRKEAEAELRLKDRVFESSITANSIADNKGVITQVNQAFFKMWGYGKKSEVIGKPLLHFIKDKGEAIAIMTALNKTGKWDGDYTAKRKDGSVFIAHGLATTVLDKEGKQVGYQSAVIDVTKQRKDEETLKATNDEVVKRNRELEEFREFAVTREADMARLREEAKKARGK